MMIILNSVIKQTAINRWQSLNRIITINGLYRVMKRCKYRYVIGIFQTIDDKKKLYTLCISVLTLKPFIKIQTYVQTNADWAYSNDDNVL